MADARDSKSRVRKGVWVRLPPPAPRLTRHAGLWLRGRFHRSSTPRGGRDRRLARVVGAASGSMELCKGQPRHPAYR